jgi:mono/diheme cytochrome c family protein
MKGAERDSTSRSCSSKAGFRGKWASLVVSILSIILLSGCDYARMKDQESIRTYETEMPEMVPETIPVEGGIQSILERDPESLDNPLPYNESVIQRGKEVYGYYCIFCHGAEADGRGSVGQSFSPLPADLRDDRVQGKSDGMIFRIISLGRARMPPLADTVEAKDRWAVVHYIRSLVKGKKG